VRKYEINKHKREEDERLKKEREEAELREANLRAEKAELQAKAIEHEKEIEKQNIRYRIASDLHDEIGSNLSSITLLSSILSKKLSGEIERPSKNSEVLNKLTDINTAAKISAESIRDIVWFINPMSDQVSSLISRMKETANMMLGNLKYEVVDEINSSEGKINPELKRNIYLIYKETLNNIIKHSKADEVKIIIKNSNGIFNLDISDNGIGFEKSVSDSGNGLKNFKSRAEQINGQIGIESSPGNGTHINLKVKL
jgi:signal transduction histidine kinase